MVILDLQWVLFILLVLVLAGISWWIWRRPRAARRAPDAALPSLVQILDRAPFGVLALQPPRQIAFANAEARRLLHVAGDAGTLPETDWAALLEEDAAAARQAGSAGGRYRNVTFVSGRTARWWVMPEAERDIVVLFDVSAQQRARQAGRTLLSDLGHELRTPIATLLTHLEILGLDDVGDDVHQQSLQLSRREARRMSRLINDMLELGRLEMAETLTLRPTNLLALAEDVVLQATPRAAELDMTVEVAASSGLPLVPAHADRLRQVFINLLDNALKYAGPGARITVRIDRRPAGILCAVCDTGPGIPPEHLPFITQRFYRGAPAAEVEGSGLGLALVQEILRHHGSELEIQSPVSDGRGTCAGFLLPLESSDAAAS